jgi:DNA replication protein DnaC
MSITAKASKPMDLYLSKYDDDDISAPQKCPSCGGDMEVIVKIRKMRKFKCLCKCGLEEQKRLEDQQKNKEIKKRLAKYRAYSLMDETFKSSTFENWQITADNEKCLTLAKKYCDNWQQMQKNNYGLLLGGNAGIGKTYLAFSIANELDKQNISTLAISVQRLYKLIQATYSLDGIRGESENEIQIINNLQNVSLLILDDFGTEQKTEWGYEKLYEIIDARYRANRPLIITTNLSLDELKTRLSTVDARANKIDGSNRILSRITEMCVPVKMEGASWRVALARQKQSDMFDLLNLGR